MQLTVLAGRPRRPAHIKGEELALARRRRRSPRASCSRRAEPWRFGAYAGGSIALAGAPDDPAEVVARRRRPPVVAHDAKALRDVPDNLVFDTAVGGLPARPRPAAATRWTSSPRSAGSAVDAGDELAEEAVLVHELASRQRPQIYERGLTDLMHDIELPLVRVLRAMEKDGIKLDTRRLETVGSRINERRATRWSARSGSSRARSS